MPAQVPNNVTGWGRVNLSETIDPQGMAAPWFDDHTTGLQTGNQVDYWFQVPSGGTLRAALVWTDAPGIVNFDHELVNDLDLSVTTPDGGVRYPNGQPGPDFLNTAETIHLQGVEVTGGVYRLTVKARNVVVGPQPYALVVVGTDLQQLPSPATPTPTSTSTATPTSTSTPTPAQGLVAAYSFNEGSGSTVADASGHGNTGTISGATWTTSGKNGKALSFDGSNDWITINPSSSLNLTSGMTLEAWIYSTTLGGWRTVLFKEGSSDLVYGLYALDSPGMKPEGMVYLNGKVAVQGTSTTKLLAWSHLAVTFDGTTLKLYVDGNLVKSTTASGTMSSSSGPLRIGGNSIRGEYFLGRIDDIRVYDRALSQAEIRTHMATPVN